MRLRTKSPVEMRGFCLYALDAQYHPRQLTRPTIRPERELYLELHTGAHTVSMAQSG